MRIHIMAAIYTAAALYSMRFLIRYNVILASLGTVYWDQNNCYKKRTRI